MSESLLSSRISFRRILQDIENDKNLSSVSDWALAYEKEYRKHAEGKEYTTEELLEEINSCWLVMSRAMQVGIEQPLQPKIVLPRMQHGLAYIYNKNSLKGRLTGERASNAIASALSMAEGNVSGVPIVALPTAGACGVVGPAISVTIAEFNPGQERILRGLATALAIKRVFRDNASVSGAKHGCQAEIGAAAAMAAGAVTEIISGNPYQVVQSVAMTLQAFLGLVCDPVGGFVICPCIYRNVIALCAALAYAELACAGIEFPIPADEVIAAMDKIGRRMPCSLRETGRGGLAATPTGVQLKRLLVANISETNRPRVKKEYLRGTLNVP